MDDSSEGGPIKREKTAAEIRKSNKPLMEKKRRERINNCLDQLKSILMEVTKKESSYYSKLEKADILEMTVKYLKNMKRQQLAVAMASDPTVLSKYIAGFNECTTEVTKYLNSIDGLTPEMRTRLLNHLANSLQRSSIAIASPASMGIQMPTASTQCGQPLGIQIPGGTPMSTLPGMGGVCVINPNNTQAIQTIPASPMSLVPAKLPTGEMVFLLTNPHTIGMANNNCNMTTLAALAGNPSLQSVAAMNIMNVNNMMQASPCSPVVQSNANQCSPASTASSTSPSSSQSIAPNINIRTSVEIKNTNNNTIQLPVPPMSKNNNNNFPLLPTPPLRDLSRQVIEIGEDIKEEVQEDVECDDRFVESDENEGESEGGDNEQDEDDEDRDMWRPW